MAHLMRNVSRYAALAVAVLCLASSAQAQNLLGYTTTDLTLREGPGQDFAQIGILAQGEAVFIFEGGSENDYYHVIRIETAEEGWVHEGYVTIDSELPVSDTPVFSPTGRIESVNPEVQIQNSTDQTLTVTLNGTDYVLGPSGSRSLTLEPGTYRCRASSPGVIPYVGTEPFEANTSYTWQFYIVTTTVPSDSTPSGSGRRRRGRRGRN